MNLSYLFGASMHRPKKYEYYLWIQAEQLREEGFRKEVVHSDKCYFIKSIHLYAYQLVSCFTYLMELFADQLSSGESFNWGLLKKIKVTLTPFFFICYHTHLDSTSKTPLEVTQVYFITTTHSTKKIHLILSWFYRFRQPVLSVHWRGISWKL